MTILFLPYQETSAREFRILLAGTVLVEYFTIAYRSRHTVPFYPRDLLGVSSRYNEQYQPNILFYVYELLRNVHLLNILVSIVNILYNIRDINQLNLQELNN